MAGPVETAVGTPSSEMNPMVGAGIQSAGMLGSALISANSSNNTVTNTAPTNGTSTSKGKQTTTGVDPSIVDMLTKIIMSSAYAKKTAISDTNSLIDNSLANAKSILPSSIGSYSELLGGTGNISKQFGNQMQQQLDLQGAPIQQAAIQGYTSNLTNLINNLITASPTTTTFDKTENNITSGTQQQVQTSNSMCFITTAVCEFLGKSDDCEELTILRKFRDDFMLTTEEGKELVMEYYQQAPKIVELLDMLPAEDRQHVYYTFNINYIDPAVKAIEHGDSLQAALIYVELFAAAKLLADKIASEV